MLRRLLPFAITGAIGMVAAVASLSIQPPTGGRVGPGQVEMQAQWSTSGRTDLQLPPLGAISASTHDAPVDLAARVERIDVERLQRLLAAEDPEASLRRLVADDLRPLLRSFAIRTILICALVGAVAAAVSPRRRWSRVAAGTAGGALAAVVLLGLVWRTYDEAAFENPRFEGPLQQAPQILRTVQRHVESFEDVRGRVNVLSQQLTNLYQAATSPAGPGPDDTAILHVSDIHLNPLGLEMVNQLAEQFRVSAVLDTGDLTSFGFPLESRVGELLGRVPVPYYLVPGNHDSAEVRQTLDGVPNVTVVEDEVVDIGGVRVLGIGDPTFTANNQISAEESAAAKRREAPGVGRRLTDLRPDVLAVHDPILANDAAGKVPLVVAGHLHRRTDNERSGTRFLTVGSSGASGLGAFTVSADLAYEAQVLHFAGRRLVAIDYVSLQGIDGSFRIDRQVIAPDPRPAG